MVIVHLKEVLPAPEKHLALTERGQDLVERFTTMLFKGGAEPSVEQLITDAMGLDGFSTCRQPSAR